jgi:hypothetical protein
MSLKTMKIAHSNQRQRPNAEMVADRAQESLDRHCKNRSPVLWPTCHRLVRAGSD